MPTAVYLSEIIHDDADTNLRSFRKRRRQSPPVLSRIVSQDLTESVSADQHHKDTQQQQQQEEGEADGASWNPVVLPEANVAVVQTGHSSLAAQPSCLHHSLLPWHLNALAIEAMNLPLRSILAKLMAHPIHNRKGIFNQPVVLDGYQSVISQPMDLGTIKLRLYSNLYASKQQFLSDVRLVFANAMTFNPPSHPIHIAANNLLQTLETLTSHTHSSHGKKHTLHHSCRVCQGRTCALCNMGCIPLEPNLVLCSGPACHGSKINKGGDYYCTSDGHQAWCRECYSNLPSVLPVDDNTQHWDPSYTTARYKKNLLKRKNDELVVEAWITCSICLLHMHSICAFANDIFYHKNTFFQCPICIAKNTTHTKDKSFVSPETTCFTFITGKEGPEEIPYPHAGTYLDARSLQHNAITAFMEKKVQTCMLANSCPTHAEKTIAVRIISDTHKYFSVPTIVQRHFRMIPTSHTDTFTNNTTPPNHVPYRSMAIALFQKFDGLDVFLFCLYVQEYDNIQDDGTDDTRQQKRVYIAYLDSVDYFRPRHCRTDVYQAMLHSYLATARARGFEYAHIWSCPPSRGNSFVFWSHPPTQKTPTRERLLSWYHETLNKAMIHGIVTDIVSLYEFAFQHDAMICPPLLDGDLWIEEACRVHAAMTNRYMKKAFSRKLDQDPSLNIVTQIASLISEKLMTEPCAQPFVRPVNAAALNLMDYHDKIKTPMDLSTVYCRCCLGEYNTLRDMVSDVKLVVENAKIYNPKGHPIHTLADDLWRCFERHLNSFCASQQRSSALFSMVSDSNVHDLSAATYLDDIQCSNHVKIVSEYFSQRRIETNAESNLDFTPFPFYENYLGTSLALSTHNHVSQKVSSVNSTPLVESDLIDSNASYSGGATDSLAMRMMGDDAWLFTQRKGLSKKKNSKRGAVKMRVRSLSDVGLCDCKPVSLGPLWLSHAVCCRMRQMRRDFFVCALKPKCETTSDILRNRLFNEYISDFMFMTEERQSEKYSLSAPSVADSRFTLLEFSQYRYFQFDTLRRAKYSTTMLLYYLHNPNAPGVTPKCSSCRQNIENVRWHRTMLMDRRNGYNSVESHISMRDEFCTCCITDVNTLDRACFVPIRVTLRSSGFSV